MEQSDKLQYLRYKYFLTPEDVADILDVDVYKVKEWSSVGLLPYKEIGQEPDMRFSAHDIMAFVIRQN
jgi:hypothetical protein